MKKLFCLILLFSPVHVFCQITFQKTFGGTNAEFFWSLQPTDGGYILVGNTSSFGQGDIYLIKTNDYGDTIWTKTFGGSLSEYGLSVYPTNDGGYIISGGTYSSGAGNSDGYLVKTDSSGNFIWSKTYGNLYNEDINIVRPTFDGGYILLGSSSSFGTSTTDFDIYLIKTDSNGDTIWTKTFGGTGSDNALYLQQAKDSGYVITGYTNSFGAGQDDVFLLKTDTNGNLLFIKTYGGVDGDAGSSVQQTKDGGYIISGKTHSFGAFSNDGDVYLIKTDSIGDVAWTKTFGGAGTDWGHSVQQTSDDGFVIAGETWSFGAGQNDVYVLKTDSNGNLLWSKTFGGSSFDHGRSVHQTNDAGFIIACNSSSFGMGNFDLYLIKTDPVGSSGCNESNAATITTTPATQTTIPAANVSATNTILSVPAILIGNGCITSSLCGNVGMNEWIASNPFLIYPNPFSEVTTLKTDIFLNDATLRVYNSLGQTVKQINNISGQTITLHRENLPGGLYSIQLIQDNKIITTNKLLISK